MDTRTQCDGLHKNVVSWDSGAARLLPGPLFLRPQCPFPCPSLWSQFQ